LKILSNTQHLAVYLTLEIDTMSNESRLILITDFIEQKLRKEQELEFYLKELSELERKIGWLRREVDLTNTIISMIKTETVYDIKEEMLANNENNIIKLPEEEK
jgi:hypothetical protein